MPLGEEATYTLVVEVDGRPLADDIASMLVHGYVDDSRNVPDVFALRFTDEHATVLTKGGFKIGAEVKLKVQAAGPGGPEPLFTGEVTALETEVNQEGIHTIVRGMDVTHRALHGNRVVAYLNQKASDIARTVASRAGIPIGTIDATSTVFEHVAQEGVSDWEFLRRLANQAGMVLSVADGRLNFAKPTTASTAPSGSAQSSQNPLVIEYQKNLISLRAGITAGDQVPHVQVRGWSPKNKQAVVAQATAATVSAVLPKANPAGLAKVVQAAPHVSPWPALETQGACDAVARSLVAHFAGSFAEIEGTVRGNAKLHSGVAVALVNVGEQFEGKYTLSGTRHDFDPENGYQTTFRVSSESERSLYGLAAGAGTGSRPGQLRGVVNAIVTNIKDPAEQGRVKVKFPTLSDELESTWARVVLPGAGPKRGLVVLPEVNDEVLVAFGNGDFQQPYIVGGLFNGKDLPDKSWSEQIDKGSGQVKRRALVSRTGMVVEFLESAQGEQVNISTTENKHVISLIRKPTAAIKLISEGPIEVTAKQDIKVETTTGNVSVKGNNVAIEAKANLELKGVNIKVTGQASTEVKAPNVKVAGDATAELSGGAMTTVKGALVKIN